MHFYLSYSFCGMYEIDVTVQGEFFNHIIAGNKNMKEFSATK